MTGNSIGNDEDERLAVSVNQGNGKLILQGRQLLKKLKRRR
jgi:hypothetical protein